MFKQIFQYCAGFCGVLGIVRYCAGLTELCGPAPAHPVRRQSSVSQSVTQLSNLKMKCTPAFSIINKMSYYIYIVVVLAIVVVVVVIVAALVKY